MKYFQKIFSLFLFLFSFSFFILSHIPESHAIDVAIPNEDKIMQPLVKNYLDDGKTSPTSKLDGTGGQKVQLLDVAPKRVSDILFGFMSLISVIVALRAGIDVLFSGGDAGKFKKGIMAIVYAAIGIVLIGSAWIIVRIVLSINLGN